MSSSIRTPPEYLEIEASIQRHKIGNRSSSAAMLAWFLHAGMRMEDPEHSDEVALSICDGGGDKGIDGIFMSDQTQELFVLQSKYPENPANAQGDGDLRTFMGVRPYFASRETVMELRDSRANPDLKRLLTRLDVAEKVVQGYRLRLVFIANAYLAGDATDYCRTVGLEVPGLLDVWDRTRLAGLAVRTRSPGMLEQSARLPIPDGCVTVTVPDGTTIALAPVAAQDLVKLPGIADLSLFSMNVRFGAGRTRINRELEEATQEQAAHAHFLAFHNGITLLTRAFAVDNANHMITLDGLAVVNGCQSLLALSSRTADLTPNLRLPVRIVAVGDNIQLAEQITYRSNNQNPINMRDQHSNDLVQRDLQAQFKAEYGGVAYYQIKVGEARPSGLVEIDNGHAAQLMMAFWVKRPWEAVRKVKLFDDSYGEVFDREVSAHRVFLAHLVDVAVLGVRSRLSEPMQASFSSVRYAMVFLIRRLLEESAAGKALLKDPGSLLPGRRGDVERELSAVAAEAVGSTGFFLEARGRELGEAFDPKTIFKSKDGIHELERDCVMHYQRALGRDPLMAFDPNRKAHNSDLGADIQARQ